MSAYFDDSEEFPDDDESRFISFKKKLNIVVDECSQHYSEWRDLALSMLDMTWNYKYQPNFEHSNWHCCIVCSDNDDDKKIADDFETSLLKHGYAVTKLWDICPGRDLTEETRKKLDGSPIIFFLCTPSLLDDHGMAALSFKDQLYQYMEIRKEDNSCKGVDEEKILVPLELPGMEKKPGTRDRPFGMVIFKPIKLGDEDLYMKEVKRAIKSHIYEEVLQQRIIKEKEHELKRKGFRDDAMKRVAKEAEDLFTKVTDPHSLIHMRQCISNPTIGLETNDYNSGNGSNVAIGGGAWSQNITLEYCSHVTMGPSFIFKCSSDYNY